jgi:Tol biopolymer transport system component
MRANGTHQHRLTQSPNEPGSPVYSPNGRRLAGAGGFVTLGRDEIFTFRANGTHQHRLTNNTVFDGFPDWQPLRP